MAIYSPWLAYRTFEYKMQVTFGIRNGICIFLPMKNDMLELSVIGTVIGINGIELDHTVIQGLLVLYKVYYSTSTHNNIIHKIL